MMMFSSAVLDCSLRVRRQFIHEQKFMDLHHEWKLMCFER